MNDVDALAPGSWQWSGWLTPKGRVIALFALLKLDEETLWLLLPDADPVTLAAALQRFVFRSKVTIACARICRWQGAFAAPIEARGHALAGDARQRDRAGFQRRRRRADSAHPARCHAPRTMPRLGRAGQAFDLEHGLPRLPQRSPITGRRSSSRWNDCSAFSVKKGCYPGQEIVARTHFLGKAKRGLALLEGRARCMRAMTCMRGQPAGPAGGELQHP